MLSESEIQAIANERMVREHARPLPVDAVFRDTRKIGGRGPAVPCGVQAQGAFGVLDVPWRDDVEMVSYRRAPWAVLRSDVRRMIQTAMISRHNGAEVEALTITDTGGAGRTVTMLSTTTLITPAFNTQLGTAADQIVCRWGSSATAATGNDAQLTTQVDSFNASAFSRDTTLFTDTLSGSKVYAGSNTTAREIGFSMAYPNQASANSSTLFDHTVISDTTVNTGQTAAVSYVVQF